VLALSLFAFVIVGILLALTRANAYVQTSKLQVMSMNLAREGVEMLYNIRDTNRKKYSGRKDDCRLKKDPFSTDDCKDNSIKSGIFTIKQRVHNGQQYPALESVSTSCAAPYVTFNECVDTEKAKFLIAFTGSVFLSGNWVPLSGLMQTEAKFYRVVKVLGIYNKLGTNADDTSVTANSPQELRFCVKVFYMGVEYGFSELCSVMTNFKSSV
jgi:hypothetical protein